VARILVADEYAIIRRGPRRIFEALAPMEFALFTDRDDERSEVFLERETGDARRPKR
jgi:hypothetical protein